MHSIQIKTHAVTLPTYLPDATLAVVRNLMANQVQAAGITGVVVNTYHLRTQPGLETLKTFGGVHQFMQWPGFVTSDSGGFQLFSLIAKNPLLGRVVDDGVVLYTDTKRQHKTLFTPEDSIAAQFAINSDIMICLDDFTPPDADEQRTTQSVERTIEWARRSKAEFLRQLTTHGYTGWDDVHRPKLFAPIQGHTNKALRAHCAQELLAIGFDGYGLGGWPFNEAGFDYEFCAYNASLTPDQFPRFALGVGTPENIIRLRQMGYDFFDCVLPTRDARHHRLYVLRIAELNDLWPQLLEKPESVTQSSWLEYAYLNRTAFAQQQKPLDEDCPCQLCQNYSPAYLHHLFKAHDALAFQLATLHNLTTYARVIAFIQAQEQTITRQ
jgi:queuine tRNA-ribosyltransferase